MSKRPMVNVYEPDDNSGEAVLVYREMNDEEVKQWKADVRAAKDAPEPEHGLIQQVRSMTDEERKTLKEILNA